jgi:hypothetical protein
LELYNGEIWPAQIVALALGSVLVGLLWRPRAGQGRIAAAILAFCWIWVAWAFHWRHYATINWVATYFASAFAVEALLLIWVGVVRNALAFEFASPVAHRTGIAVVMFALMAHPLIGPLFGRDGYKRNCSSSAGPDRDHDPYFCSAVGARWILWLIPLLVRTERRGDVDNGRPTRS